MFIRQIIGIVETPFWSVISTLLHLVGLRPRVYYALINFRGWGARPFCPPPPLNTPMINLSYFCYNLMATKDYRLSIIPLSTLILIFSYYNYVENILP